MGVHNCTVHYPIVEAGIDWFTHTLHKDHEEYTKWRQQCQDAILLIGDAGNVLKQHALNGYTGVGCSSGFFGQRDHDGMLVLRSGWADRLFLTCYNNEGHTSRLDLQTTIRLDTNDLQFGSRARKRASKYNKTLPKARQRTIHEHNDDDGGYTLYIGARSSSNFGRLYNKAAQADDAVYENCWRFEVQLHNQVATQAAFSIGHTSRPKEELIASSVWQWWAERGITPPYNHTDYRTVIYPFKQPETDVEKQLRWLREQVSPTVTRLRKQGLDDILISALGLDKPLVADYTLDAFFDGGEHNG